jgi:hypothetical protein
MNCMNHSYQLYNKCGALIARFIRYDMIFYCNSIAFTLFYHSCFYCILYFICSDPILLSDVNELIDKINTNLCYVYQNASLRSTMVIQPLLLRNFIPSP